MSTRLLRGTVVGGGPSLVDAVVTLDGDRIRRVEPAAGWHGPAHTRPAPSELLLLPGLVDVHCHGGAGHGFPDLEGPGAGPEGDGARLAAAHHLAHGTTTLLGSLVSAPARAIAERLRALRPLVRDGALAGIHLEGPFLSAARRGAQDPAAIIPGDPALLDSLLETGGGTVTSMTLAPETERFDELVPVLADHGVLPSLGHTDASAGQTTAAIGRLAGAPLSATHLFNGMPPVHHRAPGPALSCLAAAGRGALIVELIADGVHLAGDTVAAVFDLVGPDRIALVSDAIAAAGMADGRYRLGAMDVRVEDGVARIDSSGPGAPAEPGSLAGSSAHLVDVLRRTVEGAGVALADAVRAATLTPARLIGRDHEIGSLEPGKRADVLVTDRALRPVEVLRAGTTVARPG